MKLKNIYLLKDLIKEDSPVLALNLYMKNQAFPKPTIRMFCFHKHRMEHRICVRTFAVFLTLVLWHLNIEIKADYRKTELDPSTFGT